MNTDNAKLLQLLNTIIHRFDHIDSELESIKHGMQKLERHINFIEDVTEAVKAPINRMLNINIGRCLK